MEYAGIFLTTAIFVIILGLYFWYITRPNPKKTKKNSTVVKMDSEITQNKWIEVQAMMKTGGPANYRQSIMEADKLVDAILRSRVSGETMAERLKNSKHLFQRDTYDRLWLAHKIRNKVAHEADFEGLSSDAALAIRNFEKALKELKVI